MFYAIFFSPAYRHAAFITAASLFRVSQKIAVYGRLMSPLTGKAPCVTRMSTRSSLNLKPSGSALRLAWFWALSLLAIHNPKRR